MTRVEMTTVNCALCGASNEVRVLLSTNRFGSPDLDFRPPRMARGALAYRVFRCHNCGFSGCDLSQSVNGDAAIVEGDEYQAVLRGSLPQLAKTCVCAALLDQNRGEKQGEGAMWLRAAWICDDERETTFATEFRNRSAAAMEAFLQECGVNTDPGGSLAIKLVLVDVLRRAREFDAAKEHCWALLSQDLDETPALLARFQATLIEAKDASCHQIAEVRRKEAE